MFLRTANAERNEMAFMNQSSFFMDNAYKRSFGEKIVSFKIFEKTIVLPDW